MNFTPSVRALSIFAGAMVIAVAAVIDGGVVMVVIVLGHLFHNKVQWRFQAAATCSERIAP